MKTIQQVPIFDRNTSYKQMMIFIAFNALLTIITYLAIIWQSTQFHKYDGHASRYEIYFEKDQLGQISSKSHTLNYPKKIAPTHLFFNIIYLGYMKCINARFFFLLYHLHYDTHHYSIFNKNGWTYFAHEQSIRNHSFWTSSTSMNNR